MTGVLCAILILADGLLVHGGEPVRYSSLTTEKQIPAVAREDQTKAIRTGLIRRHKKCY